MAEYYAGVEGEERFIKNIELLIYSTPVRYLGLGWRVVEMECDVSDNANGSGSRS